MVKIPELVSHQSRELKIICDFSPPRGGTPDLIADLDGLNPDVVSVAYNPGKSVRVNAIATAAWINSNTNQNVVFTLATRDMNKVAVQSLLLGAQLLGLENLVVVEGDSLSNRDRQRFKAVYDFQPTSLIESVQLMNQGTDFRDLKLRAPTDFSVGATIDVGKPLESEVPLAVNKAKAGAEFFLAQAEFDLSVIERFIAEFESKLEGHSVPPVFFGVQILAKDGIIFGNVPDHTKTELESGRSGEEIALEVIQGLIDRGIRTVYLVPPIFRGGRRDYDSAARVIRSARNLTS
jgi:5,10-methylenetetrahydrofolate reductase